jgi:LysR family cys regulon transcriptional activator
VIVPAGHALESVEPLTLEAVADHPVITYHEGFTGRARIDETFAKAGLTPDIVMSALDADVIKAYVELGLGWASWPRWPMTRTATRACACWPAAICSKRT